MTTYVTADQVSQGKIVKKVTIVFMFIVSDYTSYKEKFGKTGKKKLKKLTEVYTNAII